VTIDVYTKQKCFRYLAFYVHLPTTCGVGHLHVHCCLTNLETANGEDLMNRNILLDSVICEVEAAEDRRQDAEAEAALGFSPQGDTTL
jgi:hypothetical protein